MRYEMYLPQDSETRVDNLTQARVIDALQVQKARIENLRQEQLQTQKLCVSLGVLCAVAFVMVYGLWLSNTRLRRRLESLSALAGPARGPFFTPHKILWIRHGGLALGVAMLIWGIAFVSIARYNEKEGPAFMVGLGALIAILCGFPRRWLSSTSSPRPDTPAQ